MGSKRTGRAGRAARRAHRQATPAHGHGTPAAIAPPVGRRLLWTTALAAAAAATLVRLWLPRAWGEAASPVSAFYAGDARAFVAYAEHLVAGQPFDNGVPFHPPGWPFVLSLFLRAGGGAVGPAGVKAFVACVSGASVGAAAWLAGRLAGRGPMLVVALLGAFHFGHAVEGSVANSEALYGLLIVVTLALARWWLPDDGRPGGGAPLGAATGAAAASAALVRPEFALAALVLGTARWRLGGARAVRARDVAAFAAAFAMALAPSTVAHWQSIGEFDATRAARLPGPLPRFAPVTSYGAFNFAMANHADAGGGPNNDHPLLAEVPEGSLLDQAQLDLAQPAVHELYVHGYAIGLGWMAAHPGDALALVARKLRMMSGAFALGYLQGDWPAGVDGERRRVDLIDPARGVLWPVHLALLLAGLWLLRGHKAARWLLAAPILTLLASTLMFFGYVRLGVAYLPALWIPQGVALAALADRLVPAGSPWRRRAPAVILAAGVCLLAVVAIGARRPSRVAIDGPRTPDGMVIEDETVRVARQ